jgi:hypothetical protein
MVVLRHVRKNAGERADADRIVVWDRDAVLAAALARQANMATGLTRDLVAEFSQALARSRPDRSRGSSCR